MKKLALIALAAVFVFACSQKNIAPESTETQGQTTQQQAAAPAEQKPTEAAAPAPAKPAEPVGQPIKEDITGQSVARDGAKPTDAAAATKSAKPEGLVEIYYDYDKYDIKAESKPVLTKLADWLLGNSGVVLIEGHCDERGTREYNLALGDRRAMAAKDFLIASGVPGTKLETVSYGEEKPQCNEHKESCWYKNRRAHFVLEVK